MDRATALSRYLDESGTTLGEWAADWGGAFQGDFDASDFAWREVECYPVERLLHGAGTGRAEPMDTRGQWATWLEREVEDMPDGYVAELADAWLDRPDDFDPIILIERRDGTWDIGDGWHRTGISIVEGVDCIPAVVGVER